MLRILLVEDDKNRVKLIREWLPAEEVRLVHAGSAGTAIGVIKKDCTKHSIVYDGIMLDHDLQGQTVTEKDLFLSGADVVKEIIARVSNEIPVLVHSMNPTDAPPDGTYPDPVRFQRYPYSHGYDDRGKFERVVAGSAGVLGGQAGMN